MIQFFLRIIISLHKNQKKYYLIVSTMLKLNYRLLRQGSGGFRVQGISIPGSLWILREIKEIKSSLFHLKINGFKLDLLSKILKQFKIYSKQKVCSLLIRLYWAGHKVVEKKDIAKISNAIKCTRTDIGSCKLHQIGRAFGEGKRRDV